MKCRNAEKATSSGVRFVALKFSTQDIHRVIVSRIHTLHVYHAMAITKCPIPRPTSRDPSASRGAFMNIQIRAEAAIVSRGETPVGSDSASTPNSLHD